MIDKHLSYIMNDRRTRTTTEVAKEYGLSARKLNTILVEEGIQRRNGSEWELCTCHLQRGLVTYSEFPFMHKDGQLDAGVTMKWSQSGRVMIHDLLDKRGIRPKGHA